jgi:hypothetical protein
MNTLRGSLVEMLDLTAHTALVDGDTEDGRRALARTTLLLMMIENLDAAGWDEEGELAGALLMERSVSQLLPRC